MVSVLLSTRGFLAGFWSLNLYQSGQSAEALSHSVAHDSIIMASQEGQLAYFAVTPWALLEPTVTEPSVKLQDEAALATLVKKSRDDAIEKRMILTISQVGSVSSRVEAKWMRQDS